MPLSEHQAAAAACPSVLARQLEAGRIELRVLTVRQPWASLLVRGAKRFETRSWSTGFRGLLAIHAARSPLHCAPDTAFARSHPVLFETLDEFGLRARELPLGVIVGAVYLLGVEPADVTRATLLPRERALGDFSAGRFAWQVARIVEFSVPVPHVGRLGLQRATRPLIRTTADEIVVAARSRT